MRLAHGVGCAVAIGVLSATAAAAQQGEPVRAAVLSTTAAPLVEAPRDAAPVSRVVLRNRAGAARLDRWAGANAAATGIPAAAVRAYGWASLRVPTTCHLGWTTLAGVGWVESQHGTIGGRTLGAGGRSSEPILGPALDGRGPVAAIAASTTSRTWHGDVRWDHAVGPMQFIPSTWDTWASDGDGDGVADPHDLDDAALATARYLCHSGDLRSDGGWARAVYSYNHSDDYVLQVLSAADAYAGRLSG